MRKIEKDSETQPLSERTQAQLENVPYIEPGTQTVGDELTSLMRSLDSNWAWQQLHKSQRSAIMDAIRNGLPVAAAQPADGALRPEERDLRLQLSSLYKLPRHAWPDRVSYPQEWGKDLRNELDTLIEKLETELRALAAQTASDSSLPPQRGGKHD